MSGGLPRLNRANLLLNDALEVIDQRFHEAKRLQPKGSLEEHTALAWTLLSQVELDFIQEETALCITDRVYYLTNYHVIANEQGQIMCMNPLFDLQWLVENAIQKERAKTGQSKVVVLKPRQAGVTEYATGVMDHCTFFTPNSYTMSVAQDPDVAAHVQRKVSITYNALPWWMRPEIQYRAKGEYLEFNRKNFSDRTTDPGLGSVFVTTHAQRNTGAAIGRTIRNLHMTEVSRWPSGEVYTADIEPSMNASDTMAIAESTALGADGFFYNLWTEAMEGDSDWVPVFLPVYKARKFSLPLKPNQLPFKLTEIEQATRERVQEEENFLISDEYFNWRRRRIKSAIKRTGYPYAHLESYPLTASEAFQSSGICAFPRHKLDEQSQANLRRPRWVGEIGFRGLNAAPKLLMNEVRPEHALEKRETTNRLYIWEKPEPRSLYYLASDTAAGVQGGDYSTAQIIRAGAGRSPDVQVAEWVGYESPIMFAKILYALGYYYNRCEIAVEYAKEGMLTANYLMNDLEYPNLYRPRSRDRIGKQMASFLHWQTTSRTKPLLVAQMCEGLLEDTVVIRSRYLLDEMMKYSKLGSGYGALGGHDDACVAYCIALFCLRETLPELRVQPSFGDGGNTTPTVSARASGGAVIYGVYDGFMRLRTQTPNIDRAEEIVAEARKLASKSGPTSAAARAWGSGWGIKPIIVSKANTAYSIIHHGTGLESELFREYGLDSWDVLPGVVSRYRDQTGRQEGMWEPGGAGVGEGMSHGKPEIAPPGTRPQASPAGLGLSARVDRGGGAAGAEAEWLNEQLAGGGVGGVGGAGGSGI
jgi:hypothetical protein